MNNERPAITISSLDADRLYNLIESVPATVSGVNELEAELDRANIVEPNEVPDNIITMNSTVDFIVEATNEEFVLTLVYPKDIDQSGEKISILAPVGSALLGLAQGDTIQWPRPGGGMITVLIKEVTYQPERAGELHR